MRQQFKPYTKVAFLSDVGVSAIQLTDTSSSPFSPNFVSVTASADLDGGTGNFYTVAASSIASVGKDQNFVVPANGMLSDHTAITSGVIGGTASTDKGVVELLLPDTDRVNTIYISQFKAQETLFMINYGQVFTGNALRDYQRPKGN